MNPTDPYPVLLLLRAHLEGRMRQGERRLWLQPDATQALRELVRMKPQPWPAGRTAAPKADVPAPAAETTPATDRWAGEVTVQPPGPVSVEAPASQPVAVLLPESVAGLPAPVPVPLPVTLEEKQARLAEVRARALEGRDAKSLGTLSDTMVFAVGTPLAEIVFVGEAPGVEEERQGEPFVGPAGNLLTKVLKVMGLERSGVYLTNLCKYRPVVEGQGSGNRAPSPLEMASCLEFVREEIAIIRPRVIVALGGTAITGLLGIKTGVMSARGRFYEFEGIPVMATLHPSYLLGKEQEGPQVANAEKRKFWEDMLMVMARAGLPVTEKQRAFFLPK